MRAWGDAPRWEYEHLNTIYRILHVPTGLYFCPSRHVKVRLSDGQPWQQSGIYVKSNLSKTGKTYTRRPSLNYLGDNYYTHLIQSVKELNTHDRDSCMKIVVLSEWCIEEMVLSHGE